MPPADFKLGVVLLAAGASTRMGRPKLLLPWRTTSVLGHLLETWTGLDAAQIAVVIAGNDSPVAGELHRLGFDPRNCVINPRPEEGMFSSIQCAARWRGWRKDLTHWVVTLGDQPQVRRETLASLLAFAREHPDRICQPAWQERPKHPVLLPRADFASLGSCGERRLKEFLERRPGRRAMWPSDDAGLDLDLDRPEDYERARRLWP